MEPCSAIRGWRLRPRSMQGGKVPAGARALARALVMMKTILACRDWVMLALEINTGWLGKRSRIENRMTVQFALGEHAKFTGQSGP